MSFLEFLWGFGPTAVAIKLAAKMVYASGKDNYATVGEASPCTRSFAPRLEQRFDRPSTVLAQDHS